MKELTLTILLAIISMNLQSQSIVGKWKSVDDETGKIRSVVEIEERGGKYYGTIHELFLEPHERENPICEVCPGDKKGQQILGMEIIKNMTYDASEKTYQAGEILDPESGSVYDCKMWLEDGNLMVRGYVMFLYRTQTWLPVDE